MELRKEWQRSRGAESLPTICPMRHTIEIGAIPFLNAVAAIQIPFLLLLVVFLFTFYLLHTRTLRINKELFFFCLFLFFFLVEQLTSRRTTNKEVVFIS